LRTAIKKLLKLIKEGNAAGAQEQLRVCSGKLDKVAVRRYLHPNTAHRYKSRLAKRVGKMTAGT
jgi:small subunit ribosomal protein S20